MHRTHSIHDVIVNTQKTQHPYSTQTKISERERERERERETEREFPKEKTKNIPIKSVAD